jgi:tetratricopeptide (TPR) repeat protein
MGVEEGRMDPDSPVVRLCVEGMRAEADNRFDDARALFARAWAARRDDLDACIAAHYVARHQETLEETLRWNEVALARAEAVGDERVRDFYPSLYLNLGRAHEDLGDGEAARRCYTLAAERAGALPGGRYGDMVRRASAAGQERTWEHRG